MEWTKKRIIGASVSGLFVVGLIGSAGDDPASKGDLGAAPAADSRPASGATADSAAAAAKPAGDSAAATSAPQPSLTLTLPSDREVFRDRVTLTGRIAATGGGNAKGVAVEVDGKPAPVKNGRWTKSVTVKRGDNDIEIVATKGGYTDDSGTVELTRRRSKAELAAAAEKRRAAVAARKANYMAAAKTIPYNQLEKNADRFSGDRVVFRGQIMQIQEDYGSSVILLSVTDEGYGFWTDNVWVDYEGTIKGAEDDIITVYGTIEGSKSYETQIGGETYVPQMTAKYVVE